MIVAKAVDAIEDCRMLYQSPDQLLACSAFRKARNVWVDELLGLYENDGFLSRLLSETIRATVFFHVLTLDAVYEPAERATWPTLGLLQESVVRYGLSSPRRIEALVASLVQTDYVCHRTVDTDRRLRLLTPTDKMLDHDLDWLRVHYAPLALMFPACGYAPAMRRDRAFRRVVRRIGYSMLGNAARLLATNPNITLFMNREAGMLVLTKLVQSGAEVAPVRLELAGLANSFGISRTHVRRVLRDAERAGLLRIDVVGILLNAPLVAAFDRFVADCMSAFDLMYRLAIDEPEMRSKTKSSDT